MSAAGGSATSKGRAINIALIGYGKMGKAIAAIALERGHSIVLTIDAHNTADFTAANLQKADVAIEFTGPETAFDNVLKCLEWGVPVVCGSTGWLNNMHKAIAFCRAQNGSFLYASNFSVGVNIFFEVNKRLAALMNGREDYSVAIEETHHTQKKDAPSGTAVSLAEQVMENIDLKVRWTNGPSSDPLVLPIISKRIDPAAGTHTVGYYSAVDNIEITHTAHNRTGFATGAVLAAEFINNKKGIFSMKEVLGL